MTAKNVKKARMDAVAAKEQAKQCQASKDAAVKNALQKSITAIKDAANNAASGIAQEGEAINADKQKEKACTKLR